MERTVASPERVYRLAAALGSELQRLSDTLGPGAVARLVPPVVALLEALEAADEAAAGGGDPGSGPVAQALEQRLAECQQRARLLQGQLAQAEEQNQQLLAQLASSQSQEGSALHKEREVMLRLKEVVDKQRDQLRAQAHEIACKTQDAEALQEQLSRFMSMNEGLRRKLAVVQAQLQSALEKNADLEARREVETGAAVAAEPSRAGTGAAAEQLHAQGQAGSFFSREELEQILQERHELKTNLFLVQEELAYYQRELLNDERIPSLLLDAVKAAIKKQRRKIRAKMLGRAEEAVGSDKEEEEEEGESTWLVASPGPDCVDSRLPTSRIKNFFGLWYPGSGRSSLPETGRGAWETVGPQDGSPGEESRTPACSSGSPPGSSPVP